ncbi:MAG: type II secretion system minor pseudopilin GspK [Gammaproteobacteria bacterium]|nr:type II secretion system minor pseudopilin GspK [Gammaproteobacteria bacterium]
MKSHQHSQRGIALLTALLIMALLVIVAMTLAYQQQLEVRRTATLIHNEQAYQYALAVEAFAISVLNDDRKNNEVDHLEEDWATLSPVMPIENGEVTGKLEDLQGRFNLNTLLVSNQADPIALLRFQALLEQFDMDPNNVFAVVDWLDTDGIQNGPYGAEDDFYLGLETSYLSANRFFSDVSELRLVKGFNVANFKLLAEHLSALPTATSININTASASVIEALGASAADSQSLTRQLPKNPEQISAESREHFKSVSEFLTEARTISSEQGLSVNSEYFLLTAQTRFAGGKALLKSVLHRNNNGQLRVISRNLSPD